MKVESEFEDDLIGQGHPHFALETGKQFTLQRPIQLHMILPAELWLIFAHLFLHINRELGSCPSTRIRGCGFHVFQVLLSFWDVITRDKHAFLELYCSNREITYK